MSKFLSLLFLVACGTPAFGADLPNLLQVTSGIYRGGRPTADGLLQLQRMGMKTDINLQGGDIDSTDPLVVSFMSWWEPGETLKNIAFEKNMVENDLHLSFVAAPLNSIRLVSAEEDALIDSVLAMLGNPALQPIYIHCEHGKDRTGLVIALYQVKYLNMSIEDAHAGWVAAGHTGIGAYFTGNLDKYFYQKAQQIRGI